MRVNLPVTQREYVLPEGVTLMSTTDMRSHVTYANAAFVAVSGFNLDELIGQPHNLVRHPDMPSEAFADMWQTLQNGLSWSALVKNRRKDGDHYWVRANATPIREGNQVVGYMSVRTKPTRAEVAQAEILYARFRRGEMQGWAFRRGQLVRTGWLAWRTAGASLPVRARLRWASALMLLPTLAVLWQAERLISSPWGAVALALLVCVGVYGWLARTVARPIEHILTQALAVAAGQPGSHVALQRTDELAMLMRAVNQSGLNLRSLLDDVGVQVEHLRQASSEIAAGNADLSGRTEETASSLQEAAAAMEQVSLTVKNNAEFARQAEVRAASVNHLAESGGKVVSQVVNTMNGISGRSKQIADIIGVIDGIAFQTNILALNAAVEAARAGAQGRGFAVVASEVRALAQRSAEAAREIKILIGDSVARMDAGAALTDGAGHTMQELVREVEQVHRLIEEINAASSHQSSGLDQVTQTVAQLDQMTQLNASLVEESAAASVQLHELTGRLVAAIGAFRRTV